MTPEPTQTAERLRVEWISIGERRREDFGDIDGLTASLKRYGLIQPIVVDDDNGLVAGERRLRAAQQLGWEEIDCRRFSGLSDADKREIELEENDQRKDLTDHERSKSMVRKAEAVAPVISAKLAEKDPRGRKSVLEAPKADIAQAIGTSESTLRRAEQHVETVERHPEFAGPGWKQYHVLEARERLEKLPEPERPRAVALLTQPGIPPKDAIEMLCNLAAKPAEDRARIFEKAESPDGRDRSDAITEAWDRPSMPDGRISVIGRSLEFLRKAERMYPDDPMNASIGEARTAVEAVRSALREYRRDA